MRSRKEVEPSGGGRSAWEAEVVAGCVAGYLGRRSREPLLWLREPWLLLLAFLVCSCCKALVRLPE